MSGTSSPDYKALFLKEAELQKQEEKRRKQAEYRQDLAEDQHKQEQRRNQSKTFGEFIHACHILLSRPLKVEAPARSTQRIIPPPTGKYCPARLRLWEDCPARQQAIYDAVSLSVAVLHVVWCMDHQQYSCRPLSISVLR
ncbi:hypothetical protein BDW59DRAFT_167719 [Aspergillus cavernicola]|uniref:Uncharacterized protein n=1 Tax=Aspergillus cavernicola TaxID=176166 RepID=A0ABR4HBE5_9EURO